MIPDARTLLAQIETGHIPIQPIFADVNCDQLLDARDSSTAFDAEYAKAFAELETLRDICKTDLCERIRKQVFVFVAVVTNQHEIASYVSDDFELICGASCLRHTEPKYDETCGNILPMAEWLYDEYRNGRFPTIRYPNGRIADENPMNSGGGSGGF